VTRAPRTAAVVVACAVAIATAALAALGALQVSRAVAAGPKAQQTAPGETATVLQAATTGVQAVLSYDYRHLDADAAKAEPLLTANFRQQYDEELAKGVRPVATKYHAQSTAQVTAAGLTELTDSRALVLVFVNQVSTNSQRPQPRLDRPRIRVTLVRSGDHWLIDALNPL
jgi:Mce-associated membrane protein